MKIGLCGTFLDFMDVDSISEIAIRVGFEAVSITGRQIAEFKHEKKKDSCLKELCWNPQEDISLIEAARKSDELGINILVIPGEVVGAFETELRQIADSGKLQIAFENSCEGENLPELVDKWNEKLGTERIFACLNTGHALVCGKKPEKMVEELGKRLISVHVNDNHGKEDYHLMPYRGRNFMDWTSFLIALADQGYIGVFYFEIYSELARQSHKLAEGWLKSQACLAQFMQETVLAYRNPETRIIKIKEWLREELKFGTIGILADVMQLKLAEHEEDKNAMENIMEGFDSKSYIELYDEPSGCTVYVKQDYTILSGELGQRIEAARLRKDYEEIRQWALFLRHYHKGNYDLAEVFQKKDGQWSLKGCGNTEQGALFCAVVNRLRQDLEAEI